MENTMSRRKKRNMISDWTTVIATVLVVASYIWTISSKFTGLEHRMQRIEDKLDGVINDLRTTKVNVDKVPFLEYRQNQLEQRIEALEGKAKP
jgi:hypothetical protein